MLDSSLAAVAICLWVAPYALYFGRDIRRWWLMRPYNRMLSEYERLEATRAYAAWVRNMPPPPVRAKPGTVMVPVPVIPPVGGRVVPFPGRRMAGG